MPSLLTLPREIRDDILLRVVSSVRPTPNTILDSVITDLPRREEIRDITYNGLEGGSNVLYEPGNPIVNATSLLLTNHQLHAETNDALRRAHTFNNSSYIIDATILCDTYLCPTWLSVPTLSTNVDTVRACIRGVGKKDDLPSGERSRIDMFSNSDSGVSYIVWTFYSLLERSLRCGPVGQLKNRVRDLDRGITVKVLELDFVSSPEEEAALATQVPDKIERSIIERYPGSGVIRATWVHKILEGFLLTLRRMNFVTAKYGAILYERIGCIRFLLDGELQTEWNLEKFLVDLDPRDPFGEIAKAKRREHFRKWKRTTLKFRRERGLPVLFPEGWVENEESV